MIRCNLVSYLSRLCTSCEYQWRDQWIIVMIDWSVENHGYWLINVNSWALIDQSRIMLVVDWSMENHSCHHWLMNKEQEVSSASIIVDWINQSTGNVEPINDGRDLLKMMFLLQLMQLWKTVIRVLSKYSTKWRMTIRNSFILFSYLPTKHHHDVSATTELAFLGSFPDDFM